MPRPEKVQIVEEMAGHFSQTGTVFIADYTGLTVANITELRAQLRKTGASMRVAKNTLLRLAAKQAGKPELVEHLTGPTAVAYGGSDAVATAKVLHEFYTRLERPKIRMFMVESRPYQSKDLRAIASLPPREILLAQLVAAVEAPISGLVYTLDAIIREFVGTVDAIGRKKSEVAG
jgi:large subunit ribosomal protein L10